MGTIAELQVRQMLGNRRALPLAIFLSLPVALSILLRATDGLGPSTSAPLEAYGVYLFLLYSHAIGELAALLYAATLISSEVEAKTLVYLFTRPIRRWQVLMIKYLAVVGVLTAGALVSLFASWLVIGQPGGGKLLWGMGACTVASLAAYSAVFLFLGALIPSRAMIVGLIYGLVEFFTSFVPAVLNTLTVTYYLRSLGVRIVDFEVPAEAQRMLGGESLGKSCIALAAMIGGSLAAAALTASKREYLAEKSE